MSKPKKKPNYDADRSMRELTDRVVASYGEAFDDRYSLERDHASLRDVAAEYNITILKARKILITAGMFSTETSRNIQQLADVGKSISEIIELTGLSRASVHSYLPETRCLTPLNFYKQFNSPIRSGGGEAILYPGYLFLDAEDQTAFITALRQYPLDTFYDVLGKRMTDIKIVRKEELFFIERLSDPEISGGYLVDKRIKFVRGPLVGLEGYVRRVDRHKLQVQLAIPFLGEEKLVWCAWDEINVTDVGISSTTSGEE